jgi:hypothetical protein
VACEAKAFGGTFVNLPKGNLREDDEAISGVGEGLGGY